MEVVTHSNSDPWVEKNIGLTTYAINKIQVFTILSKENSFWYLYFVQQSKTLSSGFFMSEKQVSKRVLQQYISRIIFIVRMASSSLIHPYSLLLDIVDRS